jgi:hypothetical protein
MSNTVEYVLGVICEAYPALILMGLIAIPLLMWLNKPDLLDNQESTDDETIK